MSQSESYGPIMDKPPRTAPRRRWYHRWVLTEIREGGGVYTLSYHLTLWGAENSRVELICDQESTWVDRESAWWDVRRLAPC